AAWALYGPRYGGANEAVLRMSERNGSIENISNFMEKIRRKELPMGFGHRQYKHYDPRAAIVRRIAEDA
ncbi:citrate synthase, putative, partial [Perkinsus marinus ATCC 50983]